MPKIVDLGDVIALGAPKEAALYFDRVLPFDMAAGYMREVNNPDLDLNIPHYDGKVSDDVLASLLPSCNNPRGSYIRMNLTAFAAWMIYASSNDKDAFQQFSRQLPDSPYENLFLEYGIDPRKLLLDLEKGTADVSSLQEQILRMGLNPIIEGLGFSDSPTWATEQPNLTNDEREAARYIATMRELNVVDPKNVPWSQIVEFRKDKESRKALRDLRLFFSENFQDKDPGYISDKLEQLVEKHDATTRAWDFSTKLSALSVLFTRESLIGAGAAVVAAQFGIPVLLAAGAGAVVSVGRIGIEFTKVFVDAKKDAIDRPVRYLTQLKEKLRDSDTAR